MIQAKFTCESVTKYASTTEAVKFRAVYGPGNEEWSAFTPAGEISMSISNPSALGKFVPGESYLLTFTPSPK